MSDLGALMPADDYALLLSSLKDRIRGARLHAAIAVNRELILLYWGIGREIQAQMSAEGWGAKVVQRLAKDLRRDFPDMTGLSPRNLSYMRAFAEAYPDQEIVQQVVAHLPWSHNLKLLETLKDRDDRLWYGRQTLAHGWSRAVLVHQIESGLIHRQGKAITNFEDTLPKPQSDFARELMKDPYNFEFLGLTDEVAERELERGLLEHLRLLILELGKGFSFVGSQYHVEIGGQDYYIDLLFYHLRLRCFVVIDLKVDDFKPEYAGKMNFYLAAVDDLLRHESDAPSIGMILCKGKNDVVVEYALRDAAKPIGVAGYRISTELPQRLEDNLPTSAELAREFPLMSLVRLRIDVERRLRILATRHGVQNQSGISDLLGAMQRLGILPASARSFHKVLPSLHAVAHGIEVSGAEAEAATTACVQFIADLDQDGPA